MARVGLSSSFFIGDHHVSLQSYLYALIKEAIQRLISEHQKSQWSQKILDFQGLEDGIEFESYRNELLEPEEVEVI